MEFAITICHDEADGVWFVQSSDVPGLNAEAETLDDLVAVISDLAPDLIAANVPDFDGASGAVIPLRVQHLVNAKRRPAA